ncbi:MAG: serine protease, partial [Gammaproteobacteria bacterium]|nr:serine protease [Gammaproteobacteria bacterium]
VDAFTLGSFERQLREVWGMTPESEPGSFFLPVVRKELLKQEGGAVEITADDMHVSKAQKKGDEKQLEKILGNTGVQSYRWWMRGVARAQSVARIGRDVDRGEGTGFLVKGCDLQGSFGDDVVLLTNAHVVSETVRNAIRPDEAVILFESHDGQEPIEYSVTELLWSSPPDELDTSILRLDKPVKGIEPCPVHSRLPSPNRSRVYIIGHPQGGTLSFSVQDNKLLDHEAPIVHYHAPTEPGSSGSPVFNAQWKLIAIHHAGGMKLRKLHGKAGTYPANEGLWIQSIIEALNEAFGGSP